METYKNIAITITPEDSHSCANYSFVFNGTEYRGEEGMKSEDAAAAEAFRKIDELAEITVYTVIATDDYAENRANPVGREDFTFATREEAQEKYAELLAETVTDNGVKRCIELWQGEKDEPFQEPIKSSTYCKSAALPAGGIIVYYSHATYMNYCYNIKRVEWVTDSGYGTYEDLPYSEDHTGTTWATVLDNIEQLKEAFESKSSAPFNKIQRGSEIISEFLSDNGVEGYGASVEYVIACDILGNYKEHVHENGGDERTTSQSWAMKFDSEQAAESYIADHYDSRYWVEKV